MGHKDDLFQMAETSEITEYGTLFNILTLLVILIFKNL